MAWPKTDFDTPVLLDGVYVTLVGACCGLDDECTITSQAACEAAGGQYAGAQTTCEGRLCCPTPFADTDRDGDVDQDDFGAFQVCYTGTGGGVPTGCECFDRNKDSNIDATDLTSFIDCVTAPDIPWSQTLTPSCVP